MSLLRCQSWSCTLAVYDCPLLCRVTRYSIHTLSNIQAQLQEEETEINRSESTPPPETRDRTQSEHRSPQDKVSGGGQEEPSVGRDSSLLATARPPVAAKPQTLAHAKESTVQHRPHQLPMPTPGKGSRQREVMTQGISQPIASKPRATSNSAVRVAAGFSQSTREACSPPTEGAGAAQGKRRPATIGPNRTRPSPSSEIHRTRLVTSNESLQEADILSRLQQQAKHNNYYGILRVDPSATQEEMARARRELTARLHPDHFTGNPERQSWAQEQVMLVNQAFTDVLRNDNNRQLYDQLCKFREVRDEERGAKGEMQFLMQIYFGTFPLPHGVQKYHRIPLQQPRALLTAKEKLVVLKGAMKRAHMPHPILQELDTAILLVVGVLQEEGEE